MTHIPASHDAVSRQGESVAAVACLDELSAKATPGPWRYRPNKYDDWGWIRGREAGDDFGGPLVAIGRGDDPQTYNAYRNAGTDPCEPNGRFIAEVVNAYRSGALILRTQPGEASEALADALKAIAMGYPVRGQDDRYIIVENPSFREEDGSAPSLAIDTCSLRTPPAVSSAAGDQAGEYIPSAMWMEMSPEERAEARSQVKEAAPPPADAPKLLTIPEQRARWIAYGSECSPWRSTVNGVPVFDEETSGHQRGILSQDIETLLAVIAKLRGERDEWRRVANKQFDDRLAEAKADVKRWQDAARGLEELQRLMTRADSYHWHAGYQKDFAAACIEFVRTFLDAQEGRT